MPNIIANKFVSMREAEQRAGYKEVIDLAEEFTPLIQDIPFKPCSHGTINKTKYRVSVPSANFVKYYEGVDSVKSEYAYRWDATARLTTQIKLDAKMYDDFTRGDKNRSINLLLEEQEGCIEGLTQQMEQQFFYGGDMQNPAAFLGLTPRFNDLSASNGKQIIDAGGTGSDNTSIWLVCWGAQTATGLVPEGSASGLQVGAVERRVEKVQNPNGEWGDLRIVSQFFDWEVGLSVPDFRYVVRLANIPVDKVRDGSLDIYKLLRRAYYQLRSRRSASGRAAIYLNTEILELLDAKGTNAAGTDNFVRLTPGEVQGKPVQTYRGIVLRETDALKFNENAVV